jgi:hypothetical protein
MDANDLRPDEEEVDFKKKGEVMLPKLSASLVQALLKYKG